MPATSSALNGAQTEFCDVAKCGGFSLEESLFNLEKASELCEEMKREMGLAEE